MLLYFIFLRENSQLCELTRTYMHHWASKLEFVWHTVTSWFGPLQRQKCHVPRDTHAHLGNSEFSSCLLARVRNKSWPLSQEGIFHFPLSLLLSPGTAPPCPGVWAQEHWTFHEESVWNLSWKTKLIQLNTGGEMWCWLSQGIKIPLLSPPPSAWPSGPKCRSQVDACFDFSWKGLVDIDGKGDLWFRCYFHTDNLSILLSSWRGWNNNSCIFWQYLLGAKFVILESFLLTISPRWCCWTCKAITSKRSLHICKLCYLILWGVKCIKQG